MDRPSVNKWVIAVTVIIGTLMSVLDKSIVDVAIPYMRGSLSASVEEIAWVATGYILSNVIVMPIVAMLGTRFGRKRYYLFSIFLFTVSSALCGLSWSLTSIITFRVIQGIGGGALIPISQVILRETFPPEEQGMAMGIFGLGVVLGPAFGPTLGGWLTDSFSWPWIFFINVPIGALNLLLVARYIHDPPYMVRKKIRIDYEGLILLAAGLGSLQLMLERGQRYDWFSSRFIIYLAVIAALGLALFTWRELTAEKPAVDLRTLKNIPFATATLLGGALGMGLYGSLFLLPLFLQQLLGYPAFYSGLALMPRSLAMAVAMPVAGRLYNKAGARMLVGIGLFISAVSFYQLSLLSLDVGIWDIFVPQFLQGVGFGMVFVPLSTVALATMEARKLTDATGLYNAVRQVCASVGIAVSATMLTQDISASRATLAADVTGFGPATARWLDTLTHGMALHGSAPTTARMQAFKLLDNTITRQASMLSYNHIFLLIACLFIISLPAVYFLKSPPVKDVGIEAEAIALE